MDRPTLRSRLLGKRRQWQALGLRTVAGMPLKELRWRVSSAEEIERWTEERLALGDGFWLFVLGVNNSGTTILGEILATHPRVRSLPREGQFLTRALPTPTRLDVRRTWTKRLEAFRWTEESDAEPARRARYDWAYFAEPGGGILLEKSPPDTVRARWLQRHFRPSRFVALTRHPYAVCEGIRRRTGVPIEEAAEHWRCGNEILLDDAEHLDRSLMHSYEDFTERPVEELGRIQAFLGLEQPYDAGILEAPIATHNWSETPQPLQNMNATSLERLSRGDLDAIDRIAGPVMERLGYERIGAPAARG